MKIMKTASLLVGLLIVGLCYCYEEDKSQCEKTIRFIDGCNKDYVYFEPKDFLHIPDLRYNYAQEDEILNITLYYRGVSDLSVVLTSGEQFSNGVVFNTGKLLVLFKIEFLFNTIHFSYVL